MAQSIFKHHDTAIKGELSRATSTIKIAVAWISFDIYKTTLLCAQSRGINVSIITTEIRGDASNEAAKELTQAGIKIDIIQPSTRYLMHHKFAIIDNRTVITGSYNWTRSANSNFENITLIDDPILAQQFNIEFKEIQYYTQHAYQQMLQKSSRCECRTKCFNFLVFDQKEISSIERWGDIISFCPKCGKHNVVKSGEQNTSLHSLLSEYEFIDDDSFDSEEERDAEYDIIGRKITLAICKEYFDNDIPLHAIGFAIPEQEIKHWTTGPSTRIIWKHRLFADKIEDEYDTDFDVFYEDCSSSHD